MSTTSKPITTLISESLLVKRKRGRPRKDGDLTRNVNSKTIATPTSESMTKSQKCLKDSNVSNMTGQNVYGAIEGSFEAGYFVTVKIGNDGTPLRGVVFLPGKITPVTAANDVAPQTKRHQRTEIPISEVGYQNQSNDTRPKLQVGPSFDDDVKQPSLDVCQRTSSSSSPGKKSQCVLSIENLRMVEQDEVMQVFEVSNEPTKGTNQENPDNLCLPSESQSLNHHHSPLDQSEIRGGSIFELHETPVVAQLQMETQLHTDVFHNEMKSANLELHQDLCADQSHHTDFKFQTSDLDHNELRNPRITLPQQSDFQPEVKVTRFS